MKTEGKNSSKWATDFRNKQGFPPRYHPSPIYQTNTAYIFYFTGGLGYVTENCVIDQTHARSILADLKERKDLVQMTFENNTIVDQKGMCEVFRALKGFEKLESLNFRCNNNFSDDVVAALAEGINLKKELRVSISKKTNSIKLKTDNLIILIIFILKIDGWSWREWHIWQRHLTFGWCA